MKDKKETIHEAFDKLTRKQQVELMVELYYKMYDSQKDEFLRQTENA